MSRRGQRHVRSLHRMFVPPIRRSLWTCADPILDTAFVQGTVVVHTPLLNGHEGRARCIAAIPHRHPRVTHQCRGASCPRSSASHCFCQQKKHNRRLACWPLCASSSAAGRGTEPTINRRGACNVGQSMVDAGPSGFPASPRLDSSPGLTIVNNEPTEEQHDMEPKTRTQAAAAD
jgi:hypothetical protein